MTKTIGFIGAPASGKSTTALGLAYLLKINGHSCDYVPEYAREYFALNGTHNVSQDFISERTMRIIHDFQKCAQDFLIIDTAHYCTWLYHKRDPKMDVKYPIFYDLLFYQSPYEAGNDSLRIHNFKQAQKIDNNLKSIMGGLDTPIVSLNEYAIDARPVVAYKRALEL